ncbi:MAG: chemotaxis protein CheW [Halothece sp. Uz-M2-17]|nr:chemotaxis protein CheW [Halothece sp. Uz-M2-17]
MVSSSSSNPNSLFPTTDSEQTRTESLIRFHLVPDTTALLTISQLSEVLKVDTRQLVPLPKLPSWVMGIYNWRGEILWVVDLGGLLGLTPLPEQPLATTRLPLLVLRAQDEAGNRKNLGLIVENVEGITRIDPSSIQSPPESTFTPELSRVLRGYSLTSDGEMLMVLSAEAIFAQMPNSIS